MARRTLDAYYTNREATLALLHYLELRRGTAVLEPCSGQGNIARVLTEAGLRVTTNDIDSACPSEHHQDYLKQPFHATWIITNPPFSAAFSLLLKAYEEARGKVAFLCRLSFAEPTYERGEWLSQHPSEGLIVLPRYSFTGDGKTDSVTCAWFVWGKPVGVRVWPK